MSVSLDVLVIDLANGRGSLEEMDQWTEADRAAHPRSPTCAALSGDYPGSVCLLAPRHDGPCEDWRGHCWLRNKG